MNSRNIALVLIVLIVALLGLSSCGGDGTTTPPNDPNSGNQPPNGDPDEPSPIGVPTGQFTLPNGTPYGDLRGVAASQQYVYVADSSTLYCFDKNGNFVNFAAAPARIQAVAVLPSKPDMDLYDGIDYFLGGFPVIAHDPVPNYGYLTIYGPNLDTMTTVEDETKPDEPKYIALPGGQMDPPNPDSNIACLGVYDMTVDRFGSIFVTVDVDHKLTSAVPDFTKALQILNVFQNFGLEIGASVSYQDDNGNNVTDPVPVFDEPNATGELATIALDSYFPLNRTDTTFTYYTGHLNLLRDFVGVSWVSLNPSSLAYSVGTEVNNGFGFPRVIGQSTGNGPGSFSQNPPMNPNGGLEDPDLTAGGPSGMGVDALTDNVYICDPGNRRIQVFAPDTGAFIRQIGDGSRGTSGSAFVAPSSVSIDMEGNVFVCDVNQLRVLRENFPDRLFGNIGGTVKRIDNHTPLEGAVVSLGNELGTLALRSSNINGDYLIRNILVGTYNMTATKFRFDSDTAQISILPDQTVRADFNLIPQVPQTTGSYAGNIIDSVSNIWLADVEVRLVGTSISVLTDDIGHFTITNVPPGTYQVVFTLDGYDVLTKDIVVLSGTTTTDALIQLNPQA
jgi:hypothetical protein